MTFELDIIGVFLVGCRVGGCLMLTPGFSSARVPVRVRLFLAIVIALAVAPLVLAGQPLSKVDDRELIQGIFAETIIGATIGLIARIYMAGLSFMANAMASYIGLNGIGTGVDADEAEPTLATLITVVATLILLLSDVHRYILMIAIESYERLPMLVVPEFGTVMRLLTESMQAAFLIGLQTVAPFLVYGFLTNLVFGLLGKLIPQLPSYFISVPFLIAGGLVLLYFSLGQIMTLFLNALYEGLSGL